ncbi:DUF397 domain-containing protein [Streptomyces sp. NBC_01267]|uniref:DUF397 domain-containing protein n=1 Tax=unclassified Streptomyces TaxID=2593676 RepID=UPI00202548FA|nr:MULTISPECIES: DUF397 domain-containing protein [unclassified Streptomyces]MCX4547345.1 DUF397 domain-containing protein [Streptomyces sp. NBC_01500]
MTTDSLRWFKSSYSSNGGQCVEVAADLVASHGVVPVRDSKIPTGSVLLISDSTWGVFVDGVKAGGLV